MKITNTGFKRLKLPYDNQDFSKILEPQRYVSLQQACKILSVYDNLNGFYSCYAKAIENPDLILNKEGFQITSKLYLLQKIQ